MEEFAKIKDSEKIGQVLLTKVNSDENPQLRVEFDRLEARVGFTFDYDNEEKRDRMFDEIEFVEIAELMAKQLS